MMIDIGYALSRDGIQFYSSGASAMCARDLLGRFMGEVPEDDEVIDFAEERFSTDDSIFAQYVADSLHSTDTEEDTEYTDIDTNYGDEDICTDGRYLWENEIEDAISLGFGPEVQYNISRTELTEAWVQHQYFDHTSEPEEGDVMPTQSATQHDNYLQELGWWSHKSDRTWGESHGARGRKNTFWRRSIRKNRGHRRQLWGDVVDHYNEDADFDEILRAFDDITQIVTEVECIALDRAYQNGDYGYYGQWDEFEDDCLLPERIPYGFYGDEQDDYGFDSDYDERYATDEDMRSEMEWYHTDEYEIDQYTYQQQLDELADTTPIHQHGGARGWKAAKVSKHKILEAA